MNNWESM